jgi:hypothetical protein
MTNKKQVTVLDLVGRRFGKEERKNVEDMAPIRLKRNILGD